MTTIFWTSLEQLYNNDFCGSYVKNFDNEENKEYILEIFNNNGESDKYDTDNAIHVFWKVIYYIGIEMNDVEGKKYIDIGLKFDRPEFHYVLSLRKNTIDDAIHCYDMIKNIKVQTEHCAHLMNMICLQLGNLLFNSPENDEKIKEFIDLNNNESYGVKLLKFDYLEFMMSDELLDYAEQMISENCKEMIFKLIEFNYKNKNYNKCVQLYENNKLLFDSEENSFPEKYENIYLSYTKLNKKEMAEAFFNKNKRKHDEDLCVCYITNMINTTIPQTTEQIINIDNVIDECYEIHKHNKILFLKVTLYQKTTNNDKLVENIKLCSLQGSSHAMQLYYKYYVFSAAILLNEVIKQEFDNILKIGLILGVPCMIEHHTKHIISDAIENKKILSENDVNKIKNYLLIIGNRQIDKVLDFSVGIKIKLFEYFVMNDMENDIKKLKDVLIHEMFIESSTTTYINYLKSKNKKSEITYELKKILSITHLKNKTIETLIFVLNLFCDNFMTEENINGIMKYYKILLHAIHRKMRSDLFNTISDELSECNKKLKDFLKNIDEEIKNKLIHYFHDEYVEDYNKFKLANIYDSNHFEMLQKTTYSIICDILMPHMIPPKVIEYLESKFGNDDIFVTNATQKIESNADVAHYKTNHKRIKKECIICYESNKEIVNFSCYYNHFVCEECFFKRPKCPHCHRNEENSQEQQNIFAAEMMRVLGGIMGSGGPIQLRRMF
jgi:hypothetical protein